MRKKLPKINKQDNEELENMEATEKDSIHVDLGVIKPCRMCEERGKDWEGSDPNCAFVGEFNESQRLH